jgi:hypothetical protein
MFGVECREPATLRKCWPDLREAVGVEGHDPAQDGVEEGGHRHGQGGEGKPLICDSRPNTTMAWITMWGQSCERGGKSKGGATQWFFGIENKVQSKHKLKQQQSTLPNHGRGMCPSVGWIVRERVKHLLQSQPKMPPTPLSLQEAKGFLSAST